MAKNGFSGSLVTTNPYPKNCDNHYEIRPKCAEIMGRYVAHDQSRALFYNFIFAGSKMSTLNITLLVLLTTLASFHQTWWRSRSAAVTILTGPTDRYSRTQFTREKCESISSRTQMTDTIGVGLHLNGNASRRSRSKKKFARPTMSIRVWRRRFRTFLRWRSYRLPDLLGVASSDGWTTKPIIDKGNNQK